MSQEYDRDQAKAKETTRDADNTDKGGTAPAETITDFAVMDVSQTANNLYTVTNRQKSSAYTVDLGGPSCSCDDMKYNRETGEACKHIKKVNHLAETTRSLDQEAARYLAETAKELRNTSQSLERKLTGITADLQADTPERTNGHTDDSEASEGTSEETEEPETYGVDDPEAVVRSWLEENVLKPDAIDLAERTHNSRVGVGLLPDTDALNDNQNEQFKDAVKSLEDSECHAGFGDDGCFVCDKNDGEYYWFIPGGQVEKLAQEVDV